MCCNFIQLIMILKLIICCLEHWFDIVSFCTAQNFITHIFAENLLNNVLIAMLQLTAYDVTTCTAIQSGL